jgi:ComEC/Rec2-related protein
VTGAFVAAAVMIGFLYGWAIVPLIAAAMLLVWVGRGWTGAAATLVILGAVAGAWRSEAFLHHPLDPNWESDSERTGQIASAVVDDGRTQQFVVRLEDGRRLCARSFSRADLGRGDQLRMSVEPDSQGSVSEGYGASLRSRSCDWSATLNRVTVLKRGSGALRLVDGVRSAITRQLVGWVPGDRGALLAGLVIGDDSLISNETKDAFKRTGTLHVVAISGSNLTLLASLLMVSMAWSTRRRMIDIIAIAIIWLYVLVGGAGPPTVRAGILATVAAGSRAVGRPAELLSLSIQIAAIQALIWPASVLGLSYRLSTAAIFGVLIATGGRSFRGFWGAVKLVFLTTLIVNLFLLPILPAQSRPSMVQSLVANTLVAPLISLAFVLGVLAVVLGALAPVAGESLAVLAGEINSATIDIVRWVAGWNWLPDILRWSGSDAPRAALVAGATMVLLATSSDFRRAVRDLRERLPHVDESTGMLVLGSGLGACLSVAVIALFR